MNEELLSILRSARRRLRAVRAAETAGAMIVAGALAAAGGELAWAVATRWTWAGLAICAAPAAAALAWAKTRDSHQVFLRNMVTVPSFLPWLLAGVGVAVAALAAVGVLAGWHLHWPKAALVAFGVLLPVLVGMAAALARGPSLRQVAEILDAKAHLRERLSTAVELALEPEAGRACLALPAAAPVVCAQALAALRQKRPQDLALWSASPALPAAMGLALAVCLALAFLPDFAPARRGGSIGAFSRAVATMTPAQREELAAAFRRAASQPAVGGAAAQELLKAAAVVEVRDPEELRRILERLQAAGFEPLGAVPRDLLAAAGLADEAASTMASSGSDNGGRAVPPAARDANEGAAPGGSYVSVYDPHYEASAHPPGGGEPAPALASRAGVPYADAWAAARARAMDAAARGAVPPAYRQLVRDFFSAEGP
jgi:hypothetical protein